MRKHPKESLRISGEDIEARRNVIEFELSVARSLDVPTTTTTITTAAAAVKTKEPNLNNNERFATNLRGVWKESWRVGVVRIVMYSIHLS